ncbi:hypothetical protein QYE76_038496 [Lolium multiflorum]|uniref:Kinesin motor domain-containing protein n=1 Tax=Lolium multiflorum TaxID=4521 RepID=A0AAD8VFS2_LOLMU|nr:hypothetical protein QYE76_016688 [Lolium multiflorum]KAK1677648.1 hypothetical protein QYE76_038496 [Lolium multiflorum]
MALDDKDGNLQLKGLAWVSVRSMEEFQEVYSIFRNGCAERKVAHTGLNDVSSRSHDVLSIRISNDTFKGNLNLIDLAGNEDNRRTYNEGVHLQESSKINSSLFALSNITSALKKIQMINYWKSWDWKYTCIFFVRSIIFLVRIIVFFRAVQFRSYHVDTMLLANIGRIM